MNLLLFNTDSIRENIVKHHNLYDFAVKDFPAENIAAKFFEANNYKVNWDAGSHKQGSDIFIGDASGWFSRGWSIKSAKEPKKGQWLSISSYRTTKYLTCLEKVTAIKKIEEATEGYIIFSRREAKTNDFLRVKYFVYVIDREVLDIDSFKIEGPSDKGDFKGSNDLGVKISIVKSMSSQVWYNVPMQMIEEGIHINKLHESEEFDVKLRPLND